MTEIGVHNQQGSIKSSISRIEMPLAKGSNLQRTGLPSSTTQHAPQKAPESMKFGFGVSTPSISKSADGGTVIRGGDSVNYGESINSSIINSSNSEKNDASPLHGVRLDRTGESSLTIKDDAVGFSPNHPNKHNASSTKEIPLTIETGRPDGDKYLIHGEEGSTTTINGKSDDKAAGSGRDVIDYLPHLSNPSSTSTINLESFNPSKTDLRIDGKSLFGEGVNQSFSGELNLSREANNSNAKIEMNIKPSEDE